MADNAEAHLRETIDREIARSARRHADLQARLIGYEIAIAALIGALHESGTLPLATAKAAIDEAATAIALTSHSSEPLAALRQLSARLEPPE